MCGECFNVFFRSEHVSHLQRTDLVLLVPGVASPSTSVS